MLLLLCLFYNKPYHSLQLLAHRAEVFSKAVSTGVAANHERPGSKALPRVQLLRGSAVVGHFSSAMSLVTTAVSDEAALSVASVNPNL